MLCFPMIAYLAGFRGRSAGLDSRALLLCRGSLEGPLHHLHHARSHKSHLSERLLRSHQATFVSFYSSQYDLHQAMAT